MWQWKYHILIFDMGISLETLMSDPWAWQEFPNPLKGDDDISLLEPQRLFVKVKIKW